MSGQQRLGRCQKLVDLELPLRGAELVTARVAWVGNLKHKEEMQRGLSASLGSQAIDERWINKDIIPPKVGRVARIVLWSGYHYDEN